MASGCLNNEQYDAMSCIGFYRIWVWPDSPDSDFAGFKIFQIRQSGRNPADTNPAGLSGRNRIYQILKIRFDFLKAVIWFLDVFS